MQLYWYILVIIDMIYTRIYSYVGHRVIKMTAIISVSGYMHVNSVECGNLSHMCLGLSHVCAHCDDIHKLSLLAYIQTSLCAVRTSIFHGIQCIKYTESQCRLNILRGKHKEKILALEKKTQ